MHLLHQFLLDVQYLVRRRFEEDYEILFTSGYIRSDVMADLAEGYKTFGFTGYILPSGRYSVTLATRI